MKTMLKYCLPIIFIFFVSCKKPHNGRMVSFDDYKLHVIESGTGEPTVIIEAGLKCTTEVYDTLRMLISEFTRVISYDHAGLGFSTRSPNPRTLQNYVMELHQLLDKEKIKPPYILIGHSMGGFIIRYYAFRYPDEVAGLIFIDQPPDDWFEYIRTTHSPEDISKFDAMFDPLQTVFYTGVSKEELEMYETNTEMLKGIKIPSSIPVRMFTSVLYEDLQKNLGYQRGDMKVWAEMQAKVLEGVTDSRQIITENGGHFLHQTEPEIVVDAIKELAGQYRDSH